MKFKQLRRKTLSLLSVAAVLSTVIVTFNGKAAADEDLQIQFNSMAEVETLFSSHFAEEGVKDWRGDQSRGFHPISPDEKWTVSNNILTRKHEANEMNTGNIAMLTLKDKKYKSFELEVEYKQSPLTWKWAMVGFGAENMGEFTTDSNTNAVFYVEQEGRPMFWGTGLEARNGDNRVTSADAYPNYNNSADPQWHKLTLRVTGDTATAKVDNNLPLIVTNFNYREGYIYLAAGCNEASFRNLKIKEIPDSETAPAEMNMEILKEKFASHFSQDHNIFNEIDVGDKWTVENNAIKRKEDPADNEWKNLAMLTLKDRKYKNFTLELEYYQSPKSWQWAMVGFGSENPGQFLTDSPNNAVFFVEQEGNPAFWGTGMEASEHSKVMGIRNEAFGRYPNYLNYARPQWHKLTLTVYGGVATAKVDDNYSLSMTNLDYKEGYIYLLAGANEARFRNINVTELPDTESSAHFNSMTSLKDSFASHFAVEGDKTKRQNEGQGFSEIDAGEKWSVENNTVIRKAEEGDSETGNMALLTLHDRKYRNFELEVEYYQSPKSWKWAMVGFGAENPGEFVTESSSNVAAYLEQEGARILWGTGLPERNDQNRVTNGREDYYLNYAFPRWHKLRLVVAGEKVRMYVDGSNIPLETTLPEAYQGGYIYLAAGHNESRFRNLKINPLSEGGEYKFSSWTDVETSFSSYFGAEADKALRTDESQGFYSINPQEKWSLSNNTITRKPEPTDKTSGDMALLVLNNKKYKNFELEVEYYQDPKNWQWAMVGFGAENIGEFATDSPSNVVAYVEQEGMPALWSTGLEKRNGDNRVFAPERFPNYNNASNPQWHTMRIVVENEDIKMFVDDYEMVHSAKNFAYTGGYIYLAAGTNPAKFRNLTITEKEDPANNGLFSSMEKVNEAFASHFAEEGDKAKRTDGSQGFNEISASEKWAVVNNTLMRKSETADLESGKMAMLTLKDKQYKNFEVNLEYYQSPNSWKWAMLGFGAQSPGEFVTDSDHSTLAYVEQEGVMVFWGTGLPNRDPANRVHSRDYPGIIKDYNNAENPQWHNMKLVVNNGIAKLYIDGSENSFDVTLPADYSGGYIYLAAGCNEAKFRNLEVIDYDDDSAPINLTSVKEIPSKTIDRTKGDKGLQLPSQITAISDTGREFLVDVLWDTGDYRSSKAGIFTIKGTPVLPKVFKAAEELKIQYKVENIIDFNPETTIKYYFDTPDDLKDFKGYYGKIGALGLVETDVQNHWKVQNGQLQRISNHFVTPADYTDFAAHKEVASLVYEARKFKNFEITIDMLRGKDTWAWNGVVFGIQDPASYVFYSKTGKPEGELSPDKKGGVLINVEQEGYVNFWGNIQSAVNLAGNTYQLRSDKDVFGGYDDAAINTFKIRFLNGLVQVFLEGKDTPVASIVSTDAYLGYAALMSINNSGKFDNFSITALDKEGNPKQISKSHEDEGSSEGEWKPDNNGEWKWDPVPTDEPQFPDSENPETGDYFAPFLLIVSIMSGFIIILSAKRNRKRNAFRRF